MGLCRVLLLGAGFEIAALGWGLGGGRSARPFDGLGAAIGPALAAALFGFLVPYYR